MKKKPQMERSKLNALGNDFVIQEMTEQITKR